MRVFESWGQCMQVAGGLQTCTLGATGIAAVKADERLPPSCWATKAERWQVQACGTIKPGCHATRA